MVMIQQLAILFIIMMVGLLASKINILTPDTSKKVSSLVVNIANPCFIVSSVLGDTDEIKGNELLMLMVIAIAMYAVLILLAFAIPVILRIPTKYRGIYKNMTVFSNIGFMGFPIIAGMYGNSALLYAAVFILIYNLLIYTFGVYVMQPDEKSVSKLKAADHKKESKLKALVNPGVIAAVIAFALYLSQIKMPVIISSSVNSIGNLTAPLSMMVIGASFVEMNFKKILSDVKLLVFVILRLVLVPLVGLLVIKMIVTNPVIQGVCFVMMATPIGSMVPMLANQYGGDVETSSAGVAISTVLSVATISILSLLL